MTLANLKIGVRLSAAFAFMVVVLGVLTGIAMYQMSRLNTSIVELGTNWMPSLKEAMLVRYGVTRLRALESQHISADEKMIANLDGRIPGMREDIGKAMKAYEPMIVSDHERDVYNEIKKGLAAYLAESDKLLALSRGGKQREAYAVLHGTSSEVNTGLLNKVNELVDINIKGADEARATGDAAYSSAKLAMAITVALGIGLCILMAWLITRSIVRPLAQAVTAADAVGSGNLDVKLQAEGRDEVAQLLESMGKMVAALKGFIAEQDKMAVKHNEGFISHKIPVERFAGAYAEAADKTNKVVQSHVDLIRKLTEVAGSYAKGDLSAQIERLPQEKAAITQAMDTVRQNLMSINADIKKLVDAASAGDFAARGEEARYEFDFRKMVAGLNQLMQVAQAGLSDVARVLGSLAKGDLTTKIQADYQGMFGKLKDDANQTVDKLTEITGQIKGAVESINTASKEIAQGNTDLSSRTEEQASSLEETASSMEELTGTVKQNAENAKQANQLAAGASEVAVRGGEVVKQVVSTMGSINESSKKIVDIISVIDGIAFQTNILALNAAVEAARAGEQGRGFAVVATEVRNLAQRSAAAAKEIKGLIGDSVEKVDAGTRLVDEAGKTMEEIVTSVKRVTDIMSEITAASQEQSGGIEQVNTAITQMDEVTQQNAALVEEAAAAAESLEEQARSLAEAVAVFKVAQGVAAVARAAAAPAPARPAPKVMPMPAKAGRPMAKAAQAAANPMPAAVKAKAAAGAEDKWEEF